MSAASRASTTAARFGVVTTSISARGSLLARLHDARARFGVDPGAQDPEYVLYSGERRLCHGSSFGAGAGMRKLWPLDSGVKVWSPEAVGGSDDHLDR